jgi:UDP:flavonoid glycosyltransferase YjiC (YdhE family)
MNSVSESVHFGVPMICLPQGVVTDQPLVAQRVADDLSLGIRLEPKDYNPQQIANAIETILLKDKSYLERVLRLAHVSQKTNGAVNGANYILELINEEAKKQN